MMDLPEKFLMIAVLLAFAYPVLKRILLEWAQPARMELLEITRKILNSQKYAPEEKCYVRAIADKALDWKETAMIAAFFPYYLAQEVWKKEKTDSVYSKLSKDENFQHLVDLEIRSSIAANPMATMIILVEMSIALLVGLIIGTGLDLARKIFIDILTRNRPKPPQPATSAAG